jgi:hypothetical protein
LKDNQSIIKAIAVETRRGLPQEVTARRAASLYMLSGIGKLVSARGKDIFHARPGPKTLFVRRARTNQTSSASGLELSPVL